jgi:hypothetical protein
MAHWTAHKAAWYPGKMRVCGRRLAPLTLGHLRLLECIESPYLAGGEAVPADLYAAVAIISMPWRVARWALGNEFAMSVAVWLLARRRNKAWDWRVESRAFGQYIDDCLWAPEQYSKPGEEDGSVWGYSSSWSLRVAMRLAGINIGLISRYRVRQVWDLNMIEANALAVTAAELSGRNYVTRDEMEEVEKMAAQQAAKGASDGG